LGTLYLGIEELPTITRALEGHGQGAHGETLEVGVSQFQRPFHGALHLKTPRGALERWNGEVVPDIELSGGSEEVFQGREWKLQELGVAPDKDASWSSRSVRIGVAPSRKRCGGAISQRVVHALLGVQIHEWVELLPA
jgi:hypothetical protein